MRTRLAVAALGLLSLAGCDKIDPLDRPYMWYESGVNAHNIAAMAANPTDLVRGRDQPRRNVSMESDGVDRIWSNKPTPLLGSGSTGGSSGGSSSGGASSSSGGS
jgi:uncharacterized membrane protein YgcG